MEDIYIEETSTKSIVKTLLVIFFMMGILIGGYIYFHNKNILKLNKVVVELGESLSDEIDIYVKNKVKNKNDYELNLTSVSVDSDKKTDQVGQFKYTVKYGSQTKSNYIVVKDTKAPKVTLRQLTVGVSEEFLLNDLILSCEDLSLPCKAEFLNKNDKKILDIVGTHIVDIKVSDKYNNSVTEKATIVVSKDKSLLSLKESDLEVYKTSPKYDDYNGEITLKYEKAVSEELLDTLEEYDKYLELASTDYNTLYDNVKDQEILTLYNKFGYIVGFTVRITFNDGTVKYINQENGDLSGEEN